ncbi:MAG: efflux RND transporter periplasmic adaptor subunit [Planctomycetota bacterium]
MKRTLVLTIIMTLLLVASGAVGGDGDRSGRTENSGSDMRRDAAFEGLIKAHHTLQLGAPIDGLLETVTVQRGDVVRKDQVLALLESRLEHVTMELAKARAEMEAEKRSRDEQLRYQNSKLARSELLHTKGVVSNNELAISRTERAIAQEAVLESQERQKIAYLELRRAEVALELRTIRSPIDGVVVERHLHPGELVTRQHQSKILELAQIDPLVVEVILPATLFGQIQRGQRATVSPVGFPDHQPTAVVQSVDRVIDAASNTFRIGLELPNPDHTLPPGVPCDVLFESR